MTGEEWERLVERLDSLARAEPARYRRRVGLLAGLGYAYVVVVLALLIAAAAGVVWLAIIGTVAILKFLIPLGAFVLLILRALWVRVPPPEGIRLTRKDAEPLWRALDELREAVEGPKVHTLLLDGQLNAGIVQIPRLGPLGWQRNYLVVGLPLMQALDGDEFRAVVAHELGHLSKSHGRFASWIYRLRSTWTRLLMTLEEDEHGGSTSSAASSAGTRRTSTRTRSRSPARTSTRPTRPPRMRPDRAPPHAPSSRSRSPLVSWRGPSGRQCTNGRERRPSRRPMPSAR
jgi:hypothetical protein